jgi:hypothetical protein
LGRNFFGVQKTPEARAQRASMDGVAKKLQ